ncbi:MAG: hypothetical protein O2967_00870 [Proteobacteria bacterium]|nr:hypothetical protein [Pseudomonadota bacterium]
MTPRRAMLRLILGTALLAAATACGRKGPPTRSVDGAGKKTEFKNSKKGQ